MVLTESERRTLIQSIASRLRETINQDAEDKARDIVNDFSFSSFGDSWDGEQFDDYEMVIYYEIRLSAANVKEIIGRKRKEKECQDR